MTQETALLSTTPTTGDERAPARKVFVKTYGCQMNVYDSDRMSDALSRDGYVSTDVLEDADFVLLNTCHIREKAAEKVYSELGRLRELKKASSVWVHAEIGANFAWQEGYAAFTVSATARGSVKLNIAHQEEHHRVKNYREELIEMLEKAEIEYDPRYLD